MNNSGEFHDIESNYSGRLSHVSSQPAVIPSSRALPSRDKRLPLDTWNSIQSAGERFVGNRCSMFDSPRHFLKEFHLKTCTEIEKQYLTQPKGKASLTSGDGQNYGTIPMPTFASRPLTTSSAIPVELPQNYVVGQQRQQISELQFDKFPTPSFMYWKIRFKTQVSSCSDFPQEAMLWIKEVEMVDSLDELKSSRSVIGKHFPKFLRCWTRRLPLL